MKNLSSVAEKAGRPELIPMWAGQSANLSRHTDATTLLRSLVSEVSLVADAVVRWNAAR